MNEDKKMDKEEGFCEECSEKLCDNCGKCCSCGKCKCETCHPKEKDNEPVNYS